MRKFPKGDPSAWIRRTAKRGDVVIDGGANCGRFAQAAAETVGPTGTVYAIEPDPRCADDLNALVKNFAQVRYLPYALDRTNGLATLTKGKQSAQSSLVREAVDHKDGTHSVQTITLDTITPQRVAAVKLDLQGGEPAALAGGSELLLACPLWCVEFWPWALRQQAAFVLWAFQALDFKASTLDGAPVAYADLLAWSESDLPAYQHINVLFTA